MRRLPVVLHTLDLAAIPALANIHERYYDGLRIEGVTNDGHYALIGLDTVAVLVPIISLIGTFEILVPLFQSGLHNKQMVHRFPKVGYGFLSNKV
jgi:hypothetical protein